MALVFYNLFDIYLLKSSSVGEVRDKKCLLLAASMIKSSTAPDNFFNDVPLPGLGRVQDTNKGSLEAQTYI